MQRFAAALVAAFLFSGTVSANAQNNVVTTPGAGLRCGLKNEVIEQITKRFGETAYYNWVEDRTRVLVTLYLNMKTGTSSYVTFPQPGIACVLGGTMVELARAADL